MVVRRVCRAARSGAVGQWDDFSPRTSYGVTERNALRANPAGKRVSGSLAAEPYMGVYFSTARPHESSLRSIFIVLPHDIVISDD